MLIVFSGTDGAGKSTQIKLVEKHLQTNKTTVLWSRGGYTPLLKGMKRVIKKITQSISRKHEKNQVSTMHKPKVKAKNGIREQFFKKRFFVKIWIFISLVDLYLLYVFYIRLRLLFGTTVICDRFILDTIIDFKFRFKDLFNENSFFVRILKAHSPKPFASFILTVPPQISESRAILKNDPFPNSREELEYRLSYYLNSESRSAFAYTLIDATKPINEIHDEILTKLR